MSFFKRGVAKLRSSCRRRGDKVFHLRCRVGSRMALATVDQSSIRGLVTA